MSLPPDRAVHLLDQDNTIPGNRGDGFRYQHLLFIVILTPMILNIIDSLA